MTPLSGRRGAAIAALMLATAAAVASSRLAPRAHDSCRSPDALRATSLIPGSTALGERLEDLTPETFQWSEGRLEHPTWRNRPLHFQIVRSFAAPKLYERPTRLAGDKLEPEQHEVREIRVGEDTLPVHLVWDRTQEPVRLVAYLFAYQNRPVATPLLAQLRSAIGLLVSGPEPLTLFLVTGDAADENAGAVEETALRWLRDAWSYFASACQVPRGTSAIPAGAQRDGAVDAVHGALTRTPPIPAGVAPPVPRVAGRALITRAS